MHKHVRAVKGVPFIIMGVKFAITGNLVISMVISEFIIVHHNAQRHCDHLSVILDAYLALWKGL